MKTQGSEWDAGVAAGQAIDATAGIDINLNALADVPIEGAVEAAYQSAAPSEKNQLLAELVGKIYEVAPAPEKRSLIAHLMRPVGVLSLAAVAGGIFATIRFRGGWPEVQVRADDVRQIGTGDVIALASYAQQVSSHALDGMARVLVSSPVLASSMAAALLLRLLMQQKAGAGARLQKN